jgi:hypothetical protein
MGLVFWVLLLEIVSQSQQNFTKNLDFPTRSNNFSIKLNGSIEFISHPKNATKHLKMTLARPEACFFGLARAWHGPVATGCRPAWPDAYQAAWPDP